MPSRSNSVIFQDDEAWVQVNITLFNRYVFYVTNTYVPSFILLVIGYMTFYFSIHNFNERIMVSLTSLLVETTLLSQVSVLGRLYKNNGTVVFLIQFNKPEIYISIIVRISMNSCLLLDIKLCAYYILPQDGGYLVRFLHSTPVLNHPFSNYRQPITGKC